MSSRWQRLSKREQRLAILTGVVAILCVGGFMAWRAMAILGDLDTRIVKAERDLVFFSEQVMLADSVERAYDEIAAQHSSAWTKQEIHDRLRREILRLAMRDPVPEDTEDVDFSGQPPLVVIKSMPEGKLQNVGDGYRAYQVTFRTQPTGIRSIATFLERLQKSRQALRVDQLLLTRSPNDSRISAQLTVTRTVIGEGGAADSSEEPVADPPAEPDESAAETAAEAVLVNGGFEQFDEAVGFAGWIVEGATPSPDPAFSTDGNAAGRFEATGSGLVYQVVQLQAGQIYELAFDASANRKVRVGMAGEADGALYGEGVEVIPDGQMRRYRMRISVPDAMTVRIPAIVFPETGAVVHLDRVTLDGAEERP